MSGGGRPRTATVNLSITGLRSELGGVVVQQPVSAAVAGAHINLVGQRANTLLHDGHAWKDFASTARAGVRRAMRKALQHHTHQLDASSALLGAARLRNAGKVLYATDGTAVSFRELMDAFAQRVGRPSPLHLPAWSKRLAQLIIREEHMQQVALHMPHRSPMPRVPGWKPKFADYRMGLDQVLQAWAP